MGECHASNVQELDGDLLSDPSDSYAADHLADGRGRSVVKIEGHFHDLPDLKVLVEKLNPNAETRRAKTLSNLGLFGDPVHRQHVVCADPWIERSVGVPDFAHPPTRSSEHPGRRFSDSRSRVEPTMSPFLPAVRDCLEDFKLFGALEFFRDASNSRPIGGRRGRLEMNHWCRVEISRCQRWRSWAGRCGGSQEILHRGDSVLT